MSFEVVAQSRIEERRTTRWRLVVNTGLEMGCAGIALAMVGILSMFNARPIIVGLLTLGYATLGMLFFVAGLLVGSKRPFATQVQNIAGGAVAGAIAATMIAALPAIMSVVTLRFIFLELDKALLDMLIFTIEPVGVGILCLILLGAVLGAIGATFIALPRHIRRPLSGGVVALGLAGLFQELIRPILAN